MKLAKKKLDEPQFTLFKKRAVLSLTHHLWKNRGDWDKQKKSFQKGDLDNPELGFSGNLGKEKITAKIERLNEFIDKVSSGDGLVRDAYLPKLNEQKDKFQALLAASAGHDSDFSKFASKIYGLPQKNIFEAALSLVHSRLDNSISTGGELESDIAKRTKEKLPMVSTPVSGKRGLPSSADIKKVCDQISNDFPGLLEVFSGDKEKILNADELSGVFSETLDQQNITGWKVAVRQGGKGAISVNTAKKIVFIPVRRKLRAHLVVPLIIHEIGTHLIRSYNGEQSPLLLLGRGLDHYETAEEGIATVREQAARGEVADFEGLDGYLAVSFACGLDGKKRNFRELYDILQPYLYWRFVCKGYQTAEVKSKNWAWYRCLRSFLGTSGQTPGACFTKDIIYRAGNIKIWELISKNPDEIKRFNLGKYDPTNQAHQSILKKLEI